jgi:outer membrane protein assembly factor BamA
MPLFSFRDFGNPTISYVLSAGWARDTRNDILYPTFGRLQSFSAEVGLPIGDLAYYKLNYLQQAFWPVYGDFVLMLRADLGYGDGYNQKPFPFFKAFYAGGVGSVIFFPSKNLMRSSSMIFLRISKPILQSVRRRFPDQERIAECAKCSTCVRV